MHRGPHVRGSGLSDERSSGGGGPIDSAEPPPPLLIRRRLLLDDEVCRCARHTLKQMVLDDACRAQCNLRLLLRVLDPSYRSMTLASRSNKGTASGYSMRRSPGLKRMSKMNSACSALIITTSFHNVMISSPLALPSWKFLWPYTP